MKRKLLILLSFFSLVFGTAFFLSESTISFADDEEEREDDEEEDEDEDEDEDDSQQETNQKKKTPAPVGNTTVTTVSEQKITTVIKDTDGDGLYDPDDPHPTIPEWFIVRDDNHNGIVDTFEENSSE